MKNKFFIAVCAFLLGIFVFQSCKESVRDGYGFSLFSGDYLDYEAFKSNISNTYTRLDAQDSLFKKERNTNIQVAVDYTYHLNGNKPVWMNDHGVNKAGEKLVSSLDALKADGAVTAEQIAQAKSIIKYLKEEKSIPIDTLVAKDKVLTTLYLESARDLLMGTDFNKIDNQWFVENDSVFYGPEVLQAFTTSQNDFPDFDTFRSAISEYTLILDEIKHWQSLEADQSYLDLKANISVAISDSVLLNIIQKESRDFEGEKLDSLSGNILAISQYQQFFNLKPSGKLDEASLAQLKKKPASYIAQLQVNLNRLKRLPRDLGQHYIWVNIPLMELEYIKDNSNKFNSRVIVGKPARATPSISSPMTNVVFNPPWGVPPTILKNDVGPGVAKAGGGYLARKGLRAYDSRGRDVTSQVNGSNIRKYFISQPPGARNALGEIKFNMPNKEAIYIHDTPDRGNFKNPYRALSSGCVRTENPKMLAEIILGTDSFSIGEINKIISTRKTRSSELNKKIPVYIIYLTVAPNKNGKGIKYLSDIYGRDKKMIESAKA